ncbi:MAG: methyltransferase domain-containing protein [Ilumatobacteraceae bacterium]
MGDGAWAGYRRAHNGGVFIKHDDPTRRLHLSWAPKRDHHKLVKLLTPQAPDVTAMELPTFLWPGYWVIRLGRLVKEQVSRNKLVGGGDLGPSLATPRGLIGPILELAGTTSDDVVVDLGSGDGRVVLEAARLGATGRGVERDAGLVQRSRRAIAEAGVQRATIIEGSALDAQLSDATVVFVFVAPKFVADLLPGLLAKLPAGARIVTHQQQPVAWPIEPAAAELVVADDGISSAYLWRVG